MTELQRQITESDMLVTCCREALRQRRIECDRAYLNLVAARSAHYALLHAAERSGDDD